MQPDQNACVQLLKQRFGDRCQTSQAIRTQHANTTTWIRPQLPDCVIFVETTDDICDVLRICKDHRTPVIAFGAGTSLEGHVNAPQGGVCLDMTNMAAILEVIPEDLIAVVQPGVTRERLNEELRATGLHFPIDPGADASLGGMVSTRASGTEAVRFGTMADNVLALRVVTAGGQVISTGTRAKKSAAGYDLTHLFIGSEGTLGVISEITLRLRGIPDYTVAGTATFPTIRAACDAVISAIQFGLNVGRLELLDTQQIAACNLYSGLSLAEYPTLFFEFSGMADAVDAEFEVFRGLLEDAGSFAVQSSSDGDERRNLWRARHDAYWAALAAAPGKTGLVTDACVPISKLADCITGAQGDLADLGLQGTILGHVGDGNFHVILTVDAEDAGEQARVEQFLELVSDRAMQMGGTCTGEHGVGQGKRTALARQSGDALDAMRAIKRALDPHGILNPGKIFPETEEIAT
ncbi:MAG: FAD-linked oxidase C-terminal domain-containing protein [Pseudomonadota bacterium]|nr:FAD-linked oxidase C-terminal domain-containing protein [Pseudomonadota bacterium]